MIPGTSLGFLSHLYPLCLWCLWPSVTPGDTQHKASWPRTGFLQDAPGSSHFLMCQRTDASGCVRKLLRCDLLIIPSHELCIPAVLYLRSALSSLDYVLWHCIVCWPIQWVLTTRSTISSCVNKMYNTHTLSFQCYEHAYIMKTRPLLITNPCELFIIKIPGQTYAPRNYFHPNGTKDQSDHQIIIILRMIHRAYNNLPTMWNAKRDFFFLL